MGEVLYGSARTTEAVRRALLRLRQGSARALARRFGISPTTVQKRRRRTTVADQPMGRAALYGPPPGARGRDRRLPAPRAAGAR